MGPKTAAEELVLLNEDQLSDSGRSKRPALSRVPERAPVAGDVTIEGENRDSYSVTALADVTDRSLHATAARFTGGLSPAALIQAYFDWAIHLAAAPGKRLQLVDKAARKAIRLANYVSHYARDGGKSECCIEPLPQDRRFVDDNWRAWPFCLFYQSFLLQQQW